jgi:hypothetical protein
MDRVLYAAYQLLASPSPEGLNSDCAFEAD